METTPSKQTINGWISSLAISVVCCAVLFVVFAGYLIEIKDIQGVNRVRLDTIEQRMNNMTTQVDDLYHRTTVQQIQVFPSSNQMQVPASATTTTTLTVPSVTPATGSTALPSSSTTTVPTPATQPAAVPATAPTAATAPTTVAPAEIPAK